MRAIREVFLEKSYWWLAGYILIVIAFIGSTFLPRPEVNSLSELIEAAPFSFPPHWTTILSSLIGIFSIVVWAIYAKFAGKNPLGGIPMLVVMVLTTGLLHFGVATIQISRERNALEQELFGAGSIVGIRDACIAISDRLHYQDMFDRHCRD